MNTTPGYSSLPGEELNLEDMIPMAILDGMELGTLASLVPVTKTIEADNVKVGLKITSKSQSSLRRLRAFLTPLFIYIVFVKYKK
ncbi:unnamed protein product [Brassica oleracea]